MSGDLVLSNFSESLASRQTCVVWPGISHSLPSPLCGWTLSSCQKPPGCGSRFLTVYHLLLPRPASFFVSRINQVCTLQAEIYLGGDHFGSIVRPLKFSLLHPHTISSYIWIGSQRVCSVRYKLSSQFSTAMPIVRVGFGGGETSLNKNTMAGHPSDTHATSLQTSPMPSPPASPTGLPRTSPRRIHNV